MLPLNHPLILTPTNTVRHPSTITPHTHPHEHGTTILPPKKNQEAAVLRGPLASKVVTQLLMSTEWGDLDYLLLDMPPGE